MAEDATASVGDIGAEIGPRIIEAVVLSGGGFGCNGGGIWQGDSEYDISDSECCTERTEDKIGAFHKIIITESDIMGVLCQSCQRLRR